MDAEQQLGVSRWAITAETAPGVTMHDSVLGSVLDALIDDPLVILPGVACDAQGATITATFQVDASLLDAATDIGIQAFHRALLAASLEVGCRIADVSPV